MRFRRPSSRPERGLGHTEHAESPAALSVLDPGSADRPVPDAAPEQLFGSVEAMFQEISTGDEGHPPPAGPMGRYDELWQLALADPLTGLANRMLLLDRLNRELARRRRHGGCVMVSHIDLRNLKDINDELGYVSGNEVLRGVSRRLTSMLRSEDTVSRVGESELVAVMTIIDEQAAEPLVQRLRNVLDNPIAVTGRDVRVSASLGTVTAGTSESAEEVLVRAGHAA
jgi:diguanylate cyclase (GGDEF)-like protein